MSLSSIKASTQDATSGTPVAIVVNEDSGSVALQATTPVGSKTTWTELSRTGITSSDAPTGGNMTTTGFAGTAGANLGDCGNALSLACRATCDTAVATLAGRVALYDGSNVCLAMSESLSFTSDGTLRLGNATGDYISQRVIIDAGQARKFRFFVDSVSAGTWAVYVRPV